MPTLFAICSTIMSFRNIFNQSSHMIWVVSIQTEGSKSMPSTRWNVNNLIKYHDAPCQLPLSPLDAPRWGWQMNIIKGDQCLHHASCYLFWCSPGVGSLKKSINMPLRIHMANDGNFDQPPNLCGNFLGSWGAPDFFQRYPTWRHPTENLWTYSRLCTYQRIAELLKKLKVILCDLWGTCQELFKRV